MRLRKTAREIPRERTHRKKTLRKRSWNRPSWKSALKKALQGSAWKLLLRKSTRKKSCEIVHRKSTSGRVHGEVPTKVRTEKTAQKSILLKSARKKNSAKERTERAFKNRHGKRKSETVRGRSPCGGTQGKTPCERPQRNALAKERSGKPLRKMHRKPCEIAHGKTFNRERAHKGSAKDLTEKAFAKGRMEKAPAQEFTGQVLQMCEQKKLLRKTAGKSRAKERTEKPMRKNALTQRLRKKTL